MWPASSREYTSEICTPPLFIAGTPSMKNDLNFLIFNSIIVDSLKAGTSCPLAAWVKKKKSQISSGLHCDKQVALDPMVLGGMQMFLCHPIQVNLENTRK